MPQAQVARRGHGLVLGKFMPPHRGHQYLIDFAAQWTERTTVVVSSLKGEVIPGELRHRWLSETYPELNVVHLEDENPQYPEFIKFEFIQEKCDLLDSYSINDEVDISFNLKGRKWTDPQGTDKYFNTLQAWKIDKKSASAPASAGAEPAIEEPEWLTDKDDDNELPF